MCFYYYNTEPGHLRDATGNKIRVLGTRTCDDSDTCELLQCIPLDANVFAAVSVYRKRVPTPEKTEDSP